MSYFTDLKCRFNIVFVYICRKINIFAPRYKATIMAIAIKSIPVLRDSSAKAFVKKADNASKKSFAVNFSKQVASSNKILQKAKMK